MTSTKQQSKSERTDIAVLRATIRDNKHKILQHLPDERMFGKLQRDVELVFLSKPELQLCSIDSIMRALYDVARTELRLIGTQPHAYLINRGGRCCFDVSYHGYLHLARRCGAIDHMKTGVIREGDRVQWKETRDGDTLEISRQPGNNGAITDVYARFWLGNGKELVEMMTVEQINKFRDQHAQAKGAASPWQTSWEAMARKTVIRQAFLRDHIALDEAGQRIVGSDVIDGEIVSHQEPADLQEQIVQQEVDAEALFAKHEQTS